MSGWLAIEREPGTFSFSSRRLSRNEQVCHGRKSVKRFERGPTHWILRYVKTHLYLLFLQLSCLHLQWDLVCEKNFGSETTQVALVFGVLVGAMSMTQLSDKFGRKRTFLFNACAGTLVAFVTAWVNDYYVFTALRFLVGVFQQVCVLSIIVFNMPTWHARHQLSLTPHT